MYAHGKTAGYLYQASLRAELSERLGVTWQPVQRGTADIAGVPRHLVEHFSQRRAEILGVMAQRGESSARAAQIATLATRHPRAARRPGPTLGAEDDTKATQHRTVRLLSPLKTDLAEWRLASGRPHGEALVFPGQTGALWSVAAYQSWRRRSFGSARVAVDNLKTTPYAMRHSFASLLLHEGRSVIYVARQLGHDARLTLTRYGHVIDELEDQPRIDAEEAIRQARVPSRVPSPFPPTANGPTTATNEKTPLLPGIPG
ncbi:relaxase domain-containing protein [Baekduia alba]|uniref:relaxase domain-containing protein n=1 Tax=Baekduia alba TaxID=2997333 RepID=UPI0023404ABF|nr:relaxase domain-containing protein [Baekduia alba]